MHHPDPSEKRRREVETLAAELYRDRQPLLLAIARHHSDVGVDVEAAVQDALLIFLERYDPDCGSPPLPWLILTLKRRCWALYQRHRFERQLVRGPEAGRPPTNREASTEIDPLRDLTRRQETQKGLARLKPAERKALSLLAFGYSYREIMVATGWTYTKVNRSIREGRKALRAGTGAVAA